MQPDAKPFTPSLAIRSLADVRRLEATPIEQAIPVRSTYEIFCNSAAAYGKRNALTFLRDAEPDTPPIRWTYADLLAGIHQTANALHTLGVGPRDAVAVLLPGCLEYHLALWGGEAAGIVQPLNPLLSDEKLASLMNAAGPGSSSKKELPAPPLARSSVAFGGPFGRVTRTETPRSAVSGQ